MRQSRSASRRAISVLATLALVAALIAVGVAPAVALTVSRPATAAQAPAALSPAAVSTTVNDFGFPDWYQDTTGTRLEPCLDVNDPFCIVLAAPGVFDPLLPMVMPDNFPDEFFYTVVESQKIATPGCLGTQPGTAFLRIALEGAFINGLPANNQQMVFGRIRPRITGGLCPDTDYTVTHPFGVMTVHTDADGGVPVASATQDVGCLPAPPQTCDFAVALSGPVSQSFLRWDPAVLPAAPAGYLGDATTLHAITGATFEPDGPGNGFANYFAVSDSGTEVLRSEQFTVMGKVAGPLLAGATVEDFGGQDIDLGPSAPRLVTLTNIGADPLTISAVSATPALNFTATDSVPACIGVPLARDASCAVAVTFDPVEVGQLAGTLSITHDGIRSPFTVALAGTGINPGQEAVLSAVPLSLDLGSARIRTQSSPQTVRVTNTGNAPLRVASATFVDTVQSGDAAQFVKDNDACTNVVIQPTNHCDISVVVRPTRNGPLNAVMRLVANVSTGPVDIALSAVGTGGIAAVSTVIDPVSGFPTWYRDETGLRIEQCINPADPFCILLPSAFYNPLLPLEGLPAPYTNFPDEYFYADAQSDDIPTPGCANSNPPVAPGHAFVRFALEATFVNGEPIDGDQMAFGRTRIVVQGGLCPSTAYTFTHPYGQTVMTTDDRGFIKPGAGTTDVGCAPVAPARCDFEDPLVSPIFVGFLAWDPAVAPAAPAGHIGDAATPHRVIGSAFVPPGESAPANYLRIQGPTSVGGPSTTIGETALFTVMGKLGSPPAVTAISPTSGSTAGGTIVTIDGTGFTGASAVTFGGTPAASFTVSSDVQISAVSPSRSAGPADVIVTASSLQSAVTAADVFTYVTPDGATYHSLDPARILDTRTNVGLTGPFASGVARTFQVTGNGGVPSGAVAVTGNLTVTEQTSPGFIALTPAPDDNPITSTLNFPLGDNRANGVTVALSAGGQLSATYRGESGTSTSAVIFDVTGYFTADSSGATFVSLDPARQLDTRNGTGLAGTFSSLVPRTFQVGGQGGVPLDAVAVTGNLTVTNQTSAGFVALTPAPSVGFPTTSTLNFPIGDNRANGVTVALSGTGSLSATYAAGAGPSATTDLVFDVTGYFVNSGTGATFVSLVPARILDTRVPTGLAGPFASGTARTLQVRGTGGVPANAIAVIGNLTVTGQTSPGFVALTPLPNNNPSTSTLNFPLGDNRANGATVLLSAGGAVSATYMGEAGPSATTQVVFDVTGYYQQ